MALRRTHRKSRHGCAECKRRRVKCDEARPICSNCSKRQSECEYESTSSIRWTNESPRPRHQSSNQPSPEGSQQAEPTLATDSSFDILGKLSVGEGTAASPVSLNFSNLELMMQWCNSTYHSLSRNGRTDPVWRSLVPEEALSQPLLMHGIMSLSALHLARTKDNHRRPEYISTAVAHQNQALALFREFLGDVNSSNAKAMFAFAGIVVVYSFGFPQTPGWKDPWTCVDDLLQVLVLCRGVQQVLSASSTSVRDSSFGPLLRLDDYESYLPENIRSALERLQEANEAYGAHDATHETDLYHDTIEKLEQMMSAMHGGMNSMTVVCRWAIRVESAYVDLLREHRPLALVILVHYCLALHFLRHNWCLDEWGVRVSKAIWFMLDDQWRPLAQWAMMEIHGRDFTFDVEMS
ncbi:hypothetical protein AWENTII_012175 [Aspergillus wentii]|nr:hypothetical protein MW887_005518 [Aspergillus wentii]